MVDATTTEFGHGIVPRESLPNRYSAQKPRMRHRPSA